MPFRPGQNCKSLQKRSLRRGRKKSLPLHSLFDATLRWPKKNPDRTHRAELTNWRTSSVSNPPEAFEPRPQLSRSPKALPKALSARDFAQWESKQAGKQRLITVDGDDGDDDDDGNDERWLGWWVGVSCGGAHHLRLAHRTHKRPASCRASKLLQAPHVSRVRKSESENELVWQRAKERWRLCFWFSRVQFVLGEDLMALQKKSRTPKTCGCLIEVQQIVYCLVKDALIVFYF